MPSHWKALALGLFVLFAPVLMFVADAAGQRPGPPPGMTPGVAKETSYVIVEVGHNLQVVGKSQMSALKKQLDEEYKQAMKLYQEAKKADKDTPMVKPEKKTVKPVKGKSGFKTETKAQEELQKLLIERAKEGNGGNDSGKW